MVESEKVYYPLRFSSRQGVFDLNLYVFTEAELDHKGSAATLKKINARPSRWLKKNVEVNLADLPESLRKQIASKADATIKGQATWKANLIRTRGTNKRDSIASWKEDVFFEKRV